MAATILNSPRAEQMSVYVVRAFVKLRESLAAHTVLARELATLKSRVARVLKPFIRRTLPCHDSLHCLLCCCC
jgi:hypothetical protein